MALAIAGEGESKVLLTRLERRISASQRAWEALGEKLAEENPDFGASQPVTLERKAGRWQITETMGVWIAFRPTIMPLCDVIKIIAPREMVDDETLPAPGTVYLPLDRLLLGSAVAELVEVIHQHERCEYLRLQGFPPEEVQELMVNATKTFPVTFDPDA